MARRMMAGLLGVFMLLVIALNVADGTMFARHGRAVSRADQPGAFWFLTILLLIAPAVVLGWAIFSRHGDRQDS